MLLCQIEMRAIDALGQVPTYYTVGRYGFDPGLQVPEKVWINWQVADRNFEIAAKVTSRRKEVYVDGKSIVANTSEAERAKFSAIYPDGIETLLEGVSLFLIRIFVEAENHADLLEIQEAIAQSKKILDGRKQLPKAKAGS